MPTKSVFALAFAAVLAFAGSSTPVAAQGCAAHFEILKGLTGLDSGSNARPTWADIDGDGDLDLVAGDFDGGLRTVDNLGSAASAVLSSLEGAANPFDGVDVGQDSAPAFADLDNDGDLDLVVGRGATGFTYLENTGSATSPTFVIQTGATDPLDGLALGSSSLPVFADLDNDSDFDVVVGLGNGTLAYLRNDGTAAAPSFVGALGVANPFAGYSNGTKSYPTVGDLDGDGDFDVVVGRNTGDFDYLRNDGTAVAPAFVLVGGGANPLAGLTLSVPRPWLADLDGDGDLDLTVGQQGGQYAYLVNTGTTLAPTFSSGLGGDDPIAGVDVGLGFAHPALADLDNDGDLDAAVFGSAYAAYVENTGSSSSPTFIERFAAANPAESNVPPLRPGSGSFADLDGDGDFDLAGEGDSAPPRYFENTGTPSAPTWVEQTGGANPFAGVSSQPDDVFSPALADLDGDGDFDLAVARGGSIDSYRNIGTTTAPTFVQQTGVANPFDGLIGQYLSLGDFDGDGDLDGVVGFDNGGLRYFRNTGSPAVAAFAEITGPTSPLAGIPTYVTDGHTRPALVDIDGDGDADLILGESTGGLLFYRSSCVMFADGFESGGTSAWTATLP